MQQQLISKFTRRVAFGLPGGQSLPEDPVAWALSQLRSVPPIDILERDGTRRADLPADMKLLSDMDEVMHAFADHQRIEKESFEKAKSLSPPYAPDRLRTRVGSGTWLFRRTLSQCVDGRQTRA